MKALSSGVKRGQWPGLVRFRSVQNDSFRLRFDRRILRKFYIAQVDSFPTWHLEGVLSQSPKSTMLSAAPLSRTSDATSALTQTVAIFPNPASSEAMLDFGIPAPRTVQLHNLAGRCLRTWQTAEASLQLPVSELAPGLYSIHTVAAGKYASATTTRLLVQR